MQPQADALAQQLGQFCAALARANTRLNLTGITDAQGMAVRHVLDALTALPACQGPWPLVDLGSGCGVPGIPLALCLPEREVVLVESRQRKAAAIDGLVQELGLSPRVSAVRARGEAWLAERGGEQVIVVTRAVGSVDDQLKLLGKARGALARLIMLKGPSSEDELAASAPRRQRDCWPEPSVSSAELPHGAGQRRVLVFELAGR